MAEHFQPLKNVISKQIFRLM